MFCQDTCCKKYSEECFRKNEYYHNCCIGRRRL